MLFRSVVDLGEGGEVGGERGGGRDAGGDDDVFAKGQWEEEEGGRDGPKMRILFFLLNSARRPLRICANL